MSHRFIRKTYVDPFEEQHTQHVEMVELFRIYYYSKRTSTQQYEAQFIIHEFNIIGENTLKNSNLTIFEYFDLLSSKPKDIQEKFKYKSSELLRTLAWNFEDLSKTLGIGAQYKDSKVYYDNIFDQHIVSPY